MKLEGNYCEAFFNEILQGLLCRGGGVDFSGWHPSDKLSVTEIEILL